MRLLAEQAGALLQLGRARRLRETLLVGLYGRGARGGRRPAGFGQRTARPKAATHRFVELAGVDAELVEEVLQRLGVRRRLNGLRFVDGGEIELELDAE